MNALRRHLSYANVTSTLCLFVLLGGTSYAVATGSIDSREIKNGQVKRVDLAVNSIDSRKVGDGSLLAADFAPGQLPAGPQGRQGTAGPAGPQGAQGPQGARGPAGATNVVVRISPNAPRFAQVDCQPGERATGGGGATAEFLYQSFPLRSTGGVPTGWFVAAQKADFTAANVSAYVVCASP